MTHRSAQQPEHLRRRTRGRRPQQVRAAAAQRIIFAFASCLSGFLIFALQPMMGKFLLPWFGGGPGVWTVCLLFFQTLLLLGYLYAHAITKVSAARTQVVVHLSVLALAIAFIPVIPAERWKPYANVSPLPRLLLLLLTTVGFPYIVLSATGPLMQSWFHRASRGVSPYRLFSLSNFASLSALLMYPAVIEPNFTRRIQAWGWSLGFVLFALVCTACGGQVWRATPTRSVVPSGSNDGQTIESRAATIWLWFTLALCGSALLMSTTNMLCQVVAPLPLLWVVPLALYLISFVICFESPRIYLRRTWSFAFTAALVALIFRAQLSDSLWWQITTLCMALFTACVVCHGEIARLKPSPQDLTFFYLVVSLGGAAGGIIVALGAPLVFDRFLEFPVIFLAAASLLLICHLRDRL